MNFHYILMAYYQSNCPNALLTIYFLKYYLFPFFEHLSPLLNSRDQVCLILPFISNALDRCLTKIC